ncbi:aminotransferase class III-fold pyridoxal phosphate-dependent enzyme [Streptomyces sp. M19]
MKLCKTATGRGDVISFQGAFHGCGHTAMTLTGLVEQKQPIANRVPGIHFFPYSACGSCPLGLTPTAAPSTAPPTWRTPSTTPTAASPARGRDHGVGAGRGRRGARAPGVRPPGPRTHPRAGHPLIVDEVQTGCGRTGTWFAFEQYGIEPDVIVASKALSGIGTPVALILYDESLDVWAPGAHTGTFRGNQLAFAAGVETVDIIRRDRVLENVRRRGTQLAERFAVLDSHPWVHEARGMGLMWVWR